MSTSTYLLHSDETQKRTRPKSDSWLLFVLTYPKPGEGTPPQIPGPYPKLNFSAGDITI